MPKFACIRPLSMLLLYSTVFCFNSIKYTSRTGTTSTTRSNMTHTDTVHMYAYLSAFMLKIHCIPSTYSFPPTHSPNLETTTRTLTTSKPYRIVSYRTVLYFSRLVLDLGSFSTNATVETHCHTVFPTDDDQYTRRSVVYLKNTNTPPPHPYVPCTVVISHYSAHSQHDLHTAVPIYPITAYLV